MWSELFRNTSVIAAVVTASVTLLIWVGTRTAELVVRMMETREKQRVATVQFYTDVRLRAKYLPGVLRSEDVSKFEIMILDYAKNEKAFRLYGAQVSDQWSFDRINEHLHKLTPKQAALASEYMQLDRLFAKQYERLESDAFQALPADRQISQLNDCAKAARDLQDFATRLAADMLAWPQLRHWRKQLAQDVLGQGSDGPGHDDDVPMIGGNAPPRIK